MDTVNGLKLVVDMLKQDSEYTHIAKDMQEEFNAEYMTKGWTIISSISRACVLSVVVISLILLTPENPFYYRALYLWPLVYLTHIFVDRMFSINKLNYEFSFIVLLIQTGFMLLSGTLRKTSFWYYEMWVPYIIYWFYSGVFCFLNWKRFVILYYIFVIVYIMAINICFNDVSILLYISVGYSCVLYPVFCMFISCKLKEMISLLKFNKDLIHTIQMILQAFPECVIIRSLDEKSKETIMKFANNIANKILIEDSNSNSDLKKSVSIDVINSQNIHENEVENSISLTEFLTLQEHKIELEHSEFVENMVRVREIVENIEERFLRDNEQTTETIFNVKSLKVNWDNKESFMHVFANITQVKKLEEERANREYQHMMFASLSHELRTPLNAFYNSLYLIKFTVDELKNKTDKCMDLMKNSESLFGKAYKFIKIGEVSSCLLMNLVDDILDMSKFDAKTFQLNIDNFKLCDLLKDIDYIFGFQCAEKRLDFKIKCLPLIADKIYRSDQKRIKQVLINLVSNSFKFTEKGEIKINVTEYEKHNEKFLRFEVCDTGIGISNQDIPKLFKMFGMLSKQRNQLNKSGSGIGLSISKKIVESLGGKIKVSSHENQWTKFTFTTKCTIENESISSNSNNIENRSIQLVEEEESKYQIRQVKFIE